MKKTLKDYITVLFGTTFARGISFLTTILLARVLGPFEFGKFSIFYMVMILIWQLPQAFDMTFVRYAKTANGKEEKKEFLKISVFLKLVYSAALLVLSYPSAIFLAKYCFGKPEIKNILMASLICGVFLSFLMSIAIIFQEKEKFLQFSILNAFYSVTIFCILLALKIINLKFTLKVVIFIFLLVSITIGIVSLILLFKKKIKNLFPLNTIILKKTFSLGKWVFGVSCIFYLFQRLDFLFLSRYVKYELLGIYSAAMQLVMIISLMTGSLSGVFLPKSSVALQSKASLKSYIKESISAIIVINSFIVVLMIFSPFLIKMFYGNEYLLANTPFLILLIGWFVSVFYLPFSFLFYTLEDSRTRFFLELSKIIFAVIFLFILVPGYTLIGAALAVSLSLILNTLVSFGVLRYKITKFYNRISV